MNKPQKNKNGYYCKNIVVGRNPNGTYIRKYVRAKTLHELNSKVAEVIQQINQGLRVWEGTMTFKELASIWLNDYHISETANWRYSQEILIKKHLLPSLGNMAVKNIRQIHLQTIIANLSRAGYATETMKK